MINWFIKKFIIGKVNSLLEKNKGNVTKVRETLNLWISRIENITGCLKSLLAKLEDNQIDSDEVKQTTDEIKKLVGEWK